MFKVNDLFCGCGGMGLGFKNAHFDIVGAWDFDEYAVTSYKANVGDHVKLMDISKMNYSDLPQADVWTFGFPCQDLSLSGRMAGLIEGKRSGLFFEVMRLLKETEIHQKENLPAIILAENVRGLKPYLNILEEEYEKHGYKAYYALLNSRYWGTAQNRERYFVVGVRQDINLEFTLPNEIKDETTKLSDTLDTDADEKLYHQQDRTDILVRRLNLDPDVDFVKSCSLRTRAYRGQEQQLEVRKDDVSNTITTVYKDFMLIEKKGANVRLRRPSVREAARLQGFPNSYQIVVSESRAYRQFGNAVTVNVAEAIANEISNFLKNGDDYFV